MKYLVYDIETIQPDWTPPPDKPDAFPPPWKHQVVAIGMVGLDENLRPLQPTPFVVTSCSSGADERAMVQRWVDAGSRVDRLVEWCGSRFDFPVLQTKALKYGIAMPWAFRKMHNGKNAQEFRHRYQGGMIDLCERWTNYGQGIRPKLMDIMQLIGMPGKLDMDGSKVGEAYAAGKFDEIARYVMHDAIQTAFLFQRWEYLCGRVELPQYQGAAKALWYETSLKYPELLETADRETLLMSAPQEQKELNL